MLASGDLTEEELVTEILSDNPFVEDRLDVLINCLVMQFDPNAVLPDHRVQQLGRSILDVLEHAVDWFPKGESN